MGTPRDRTDLQTKIRIGVRRLPSAFGQLLNRIGLVIFLSFASSTIQAQLRIVTYNPTGPPSAGMDIVLRSIGEESRSGIAKPIDVLLLQETSRTADLPDTQAFVDLLNSMYAGQTSGGQPITYARGNLVGKVSFSEDTSQSIVYRTQMVQLVNESTVGIASGSGQPRQSLRYHIRPAGYDSRAEFYIYNSHYKASQDDDPIAAGSNAQRRNAEALAIRTNSNALPAASHLIYAGDFNFYDYDADEPAVGTLLATGNGQAVDPIDKIGPWHINSSYASYHTQSPCSSPGGNCGAGGGMDDRFDFQFVSTEMMDGEGIDYIPGSYHAFGNNGSTFNSAINNGNTINFAAAGVATYTKTQILNALETVTDHIPVVADYQLPAVMQIVADVIPARLNVGDVFNLGVTVSNAASVVAAIGADELNYAITTSGAVSGSFLNQVDAALGAGNMHQLAVDTSTLGIKAGSIAVTSTSPMVQNGMINIPISYLVVLPGDYDENGEVNAADYIQWRSTLGQNVVNGSGADGSGNGVVDDDDYGIWTANFGRSATIAAGATAGQVFATANLSNSAVPESSSCCLVIFGVCLVSSAGGTLREWTRRT